MEKFEYKADVKQYCAASLGDSEGELLYLKEMGLEGWILSCVVKVGYPHVYYWRRKIE